MRFQPDEADQIINFFILHLKEHGKPPTVSDFHRIMTTFPGVRSNEAEKRLPFIKTCDRKTTASNLIEVWQNSELKHIKTPSDEKIERIEELEKRILGLPSSNLTRVAVAKVHTKEQNTCSRMAGRLASQFFTEDSNIFLPNKKYGIGSGRAILEMCQAISHMKIPNAHNMTFFSMTGSTLPVHFPQRGREVFHADQNVLRIVEGFPSNCNVVRMGTSLIYNQRVLKEIQNDRWISDILKFYHLQELDNLSSDDAREILNIRSRIPDRCIVGAGSFEPGHVLFDLITRKDKTPTEKNYLAPIKKPFEHVVQLSQSFNSEFGFYPIGEIGNRYFCVDLPNQLNNRASSRAKEIILKIEKHLGVTVNNHFLCTPKRMYSDAITGVVAGGWEKAHAIRTLLKNKTAQITYLVVDEHLARSILQ